MFDLISDPHLLRPPPPRADARARSRRCLSVSLSPCLASPWKMRLETIYAFSTPFPSSPFLPPPALSQDRPRLIDLSVRRRFVVFSFSTSRQTGPDRRRRYKDLDPGGRVGPWVDGGPRSTVPRSSYIQAAWRHRNQSRKQHLFFLLST